MRRSVCLALALSTLLLPLALMNCTDTTMPADDDNGNGEEPEPTYELLLSLQHSEEIRHEKELPLTVMASHRRSDTGDLNPASSAQLTIVVANGTADDETGTTDDDGIFSTLIQSGAEGDSMVISVSGVSPPAPDTTISASVALVTCPPSIEIIAPSVVHYCDGYGMFEVEAHGDCGCEDPTLEPNTRLKIFMDGLDGDLFLERVWAGNECSALVDLMTLRDPFVYVIGSFQCSPDEESVADTVAIMVVNP